MSARQPFPHPLAPLADVIAQRFRVLAEPMRIKLLDQLREGDATVGELQAALGASQQNISKHLGILHNAGMVTRTKDGNLGQPGCPPPAARSRRTATGITTSGHLLCAQPLLPTELEFVEVRRRR